MRGVRGKARPQLFIDIKDLKWFMPKTSVDLLLAGILMKEWSKMEYTGNIAIVCCLSG